MDIAGDDLLEGAECPFGLGLDLLGADAVEASEGAPSRGGLRLGRRPQCRRLRAEMRRGPGRYRPRCRRK
ncbi:hypothetical protein DF18_36975 [Streptomyces rimosus]|nr:hypothetical protein DF18_36975 [Streptomyces rimosus]